MKFRALALALIGALLVVSVSLVPPTDAQEQLAEQYTRIQFGDSFDTLAPFLAETGIIGSLSSSDPVVAEISASELALVDAARLRYRVLIRDMASYYASRAISEAAFGSGAELRSSGPEVSSTLAARSTGADAPPAPQPANFEVSPPGSMGGFYTFSQVEAELDQMQAFRPDLITVKQSIGNSLNGNPIWMVKISDNPNVDENEPEVLQNSLIHGREPMAMAQNLYYMWHILEEYDNDPLIKGMIDNTEIYFVPVSNPDGYLHNEFTNPNGGGLWRKNRRLNSDGSIGVDLNRNFGFQWGYDNLGSSPTPSSNTYRGTAPFSEPENQHMRDFVQSRNFTSVLNYHGAVGEIYYPWGYDGAAGIADPRFPVLAEVYTRDNNYPFGTGPEELYVTNGESDDWFWGSEGIFAMTPEVGPTSGDFWPAPSQIVGLAQEHVEANKMLARLAGVWGDANDVSSGGAIDAGASGQVAFSVTRKGLADGDFIVAVTPTSSNVAASCSPVVFSGMAFDETRSGVCDFDVSSGASIGDPIQFEIAVNNGDYDIHTLDTQFVVADPNSTAVLDSNFDAGVDGFAYSDDLFRSTSQPAYASGSWASTGGFSGGGLEVVVGGLNNDDIFNMSGGWTKSFTLAQESDVSITLRYDLRQEGTEESNELGQALLSIDGTLIGVSPNDYLAQISGDGNTGPPITTGWQQVTLSAGTLNAGTHTIGIGGFLSLKTLADESTTVVFDDVLVDATPTGPSNAAPTALASATPTTGDAPLAVSFSSAGSSDSDGTIAGYDWDFGDGGSSTSPNPTHTYTSGGSFTATLTVTDDDGATDTDTVAITAVANQAPNAAASASAISGENPLTIDFDGSTSSDGDGTIVLYDWDFGDGSSDTGPTPTYTYTSTGAFTATLTVTDDDGATDSDSVIITVNDPPPNQDPSAVAVATPDTGDGPLTVSFDAAGSSDPDGTIVSYDWDFGDGGSDTGLTATNVYNSIGSYTATLTVTDEDGATGTTTLAITVTDPNSVAILNASFDAGDDGFGYDDDTFRNTNLPQYASGVWNVNGGFSGGGLEVALGGIDGDDVFGMSGGWSNTFTLAAQTDVTITLRYDLRQEGTEEPDEIGDALVSVDGVLVGVPPNDYVDQILGDGNSGPPILTGWQQVTLDVGELAPGTHTVTLGGYFSKKTFPDETTTIVFDDVQITGVEVASPVNVDPVAVASASPVSGDSPLTVVFDGSGSSDSDGSIVSYDWDFGDGGSDSGVSPAYVFTSAGSFAATLTVTDDDGASASDTVVITVSDPPVNVDPVAVASASPVSGDSPLTVVFDGSGSSDSDGSIVSYDWDFGDGGSDSGVSPAYVFTSAGSFAATLTVTDDDGASASDTVVITVSDPPSGPLIETDVVTNVGDTWQTISLTNTYVSPVVVATVRMLDSSDDPVVTRVRSAGPTSFELRVQTTNGAPAPLVDVHYLVVDEGVYSDAADGVTMEAVRVNSTITAENNNWAREQRSYQNSYTNPVVVGQVMSDNDSDWSVFWASATNSRTAPPNAGSFSAGKHVGEDPDATRADETIGYIVIESGSGTVAGLNFEAGLGADAVRGITQTSSGYLYSLNGGTQPSSAVVSAAAIDGNNGGWPVLYGFAPLSPGEMRLAYEEDIANDGERNHTNEQVAYIVFS